MNGLNQLLESHFLQHRRRDTAKIDREKKNFAVGLAEKVLVLHRESSARNVKNNENTYKAMGFFP